MGNTTHLWLNTFPTSRVPSQSSHLLLPSLTPPHIPWPQLPPPPISSLSSIQSTCSLQPRWDPAMKTFVTFTFIIYTQKKWFAKCALKILIEWEKEKYFPYIDLSLWHLKLLCNVYKTSALCTVVFNGELFGFPNSHL